MNALVQNKNSTFVYAEAFPRHNHQRIKLQRLFLGIPIKIVCAKSKKKEGKKNITQYNHTSSLQLHFKWSK